MNHQSKNKGFTLIEVIIVIMIIMILGIILTQNFDNVKKRYPEIKTEQIQKDIPKPVQNNAKEKMGNEL
jgi:prepilin-type N-terminal cleavage/methylation domain-containing protein